MGVRTAVAMAGSTATGLTATGLTERAGPENVAKQTAAPQETKNAENIRFFMIHIHPSRSH